ncbi:MAG: glycoside hydrolase family 32 protein [uncultured Clostridium sp.]
MKRPQIHMTPESNWMNDPNGFIYFNEEYHLYYQHFPYECNWGTMHWGHATSTDMINWSHHGIALYPSKQYDRNGCFSGTALIENREMTLYYTAVRYNETEKESIHHPYDNYSFESSQAKIISKDGYNFNNKDDKKMILAPLEDISLGHKTHTRDPKVWKYNDKYLMIIGSKFIKEDQDKFTGEVLFYESIDGDNWTYKNRFFDDSIGDMWECPDLFNVNGTNILVISPEQITKDGVNYTNNSVYAIVNFDEESCEMSLKSEFSYLDYGLDVYAAQSNIDKNGNRVMFGWVRMPEKFEGENWIGMMTLPRVVNVKNEKVYFDVTEEVKALFKDKVTIDEFNNKDIFKLEAALNEDSKINIGGYIILVEDDAIKVDRSNVFVEAECIGKVFKTPKLHGNYNIVAYIDNGIIEIFINDGEYVITNVIYNVKNYIEIQNVNKLDIYK